MATEQNIQTTQSPGLSPTMKTFYRKHLLENMRSNLVHYQFGQRSSIPKNNGTTIEWRKFIPFAPATKPLEEGITPDGHDITITKLTATIEQYGDYVRTSDKLVLTALDPIITKCVEENAEQASTTIDTLTRDVMHGGTCVLYAGEKKSRYTVEMSNVLTTKEVRKARRTLKKNKAKKFKGGFYIAIVGPDTVYDLQDDPKWLDVAKYQEKEKIFTGEIGKLYGVKFVETEEAKLLNPTELPQMTVASWTDGTKTAVLEEALSEDEATELVGQEILVVDASDDSEHYTTIISAEAGIAGAASVILDDNNSGLGISVSAGDTFIAGDAGKSAIPLASTIIFGADSYGVVDIDGKGKNASVYVEPPGSAGSADPLHQRGTVGWKIPAFVAKRLQEVWMVRVEHGYTDAA